MKPHVSPLFVTDTAGFRSETTLKETDMQAIAMSHTLSSYPSETVAAKQTISDHAVCRADRTCIRTLVKCHLSIKPTTQQDQDSSKDGANQTHSHNHQLSNPPASPDHRDH